jgi:NAD-dependent dihydropyrimidine dehydrogenase PreA subunit
MKRRIIEIDEEKCTGCGLCADACHEGAIALVDGKARLRREDYCDGLGDCLPACPAGAIRFVEREAKAYHAAAVAAAKDAKRASSHACPGSRAQTLADAAPPTQAPEAPALFSRLAQWPCQLKLVPTRAPFFDGAELLIAADCTAYAYARVHEDFMRGRVTLIGCPKLDGVDYSEKLTEILAQNEIRSVTVLRMEVPCCGGLALAVQNALRGCGRRIPAQTVTVSIRGELLPD